MAEVIEASRARAGHSSTSTSAAGGGPPADPSSSIYLKSSRRPPVPGRESKTLAGGRDASPATVGSRGTDKGKLPSPRGKVAAVTSPPATPGVGAPGTGGGGSVTSSPLRQMQQVSSGSPCGGVTPRRHNKLEPAPASGASLVNGKASIAAGTPLGEGGEEAPLGFEPEGSDAANPTPPYKEQLTPRVLSPPPASGAPGPSAVQSLLMGTSGLSSGPAGTGTGTSTPGYRAWADSTEALLNDADGVTLFRQFLERDKCVHLHDFYLAWKCMQAPKTSVEVRSQLVTLMYKKYIKSKGGSTGGGGGACKVSSTLNLSSAICDGIKKAVKQWSMASSAESGTPQPPITLYDEVIEKVLEHFGVVQREFLKSDLYAQYVRGLESPARLTGGASGSNGASAGDSPGSGVDSPMLGMTNFLESVPEDKELNLTRQTESSGGQMTDRMRQRLSNGEDPDSVFRSGNGVRPEMPGPYKFASGVGVYLPVSVVDSEAGSMSSDALTDDTLTDTNSSVGDVGGLYTHKQRQRHRQMIKKKAARNTETHLNYLPPNLSLPKNPLLAEKYPAKFAEDICRRLQKYLDDKAREAREEELKRKFDCMIKRAEPAEEPAPAPVHHVMKPTSDLRKLMNSLDVGPAGDPSSDAPQNILDKHCRRVWKDKSEQQTPAAARSPQRSKSPNMGVPGGVGVAPPGGAPAGTMGAALGPPAGIVVDHPPGAMIGGPAGVVGVPGAVPAGGKSAKKRTPSGGMSGGPLPCVPADTRPPVDMKVSDWIVAHMGVGKKEGGSGSSKHRQPGASHRGKPSSTSRLMSESQHSTSSQGRKSGSQRPKQSDSASEAATASGYGSGDKTGAGPEKLGVVIYLLEEPIPYSMEHPESQITLAQFKQLVSHKKSSYRYFFKKTSDGFPSGVYEEVQSENAVLPKWEGRVIGKIDDMKPSC